MASALIYPAVAIGVQAGPAALGRALALALAAALVVGLVFGVIRFRVGSILVAAVLPLVLWVAVWGSYSFLRDLLGGALGVTMAWMLARLLKGWHSAAAGPPGDVERPRRRFLRRLLVLSFASVWIINSGLDLIFESDPLPRLEAPLSAARTDQAPWPELRVGVALSGGGYRAALMHAGVLAELDAMRIPVTAVSTVSGGSIVGSYYAAGGAPKTFRDALADGRLNLKRDMADIHNALRLPFPMKLPYVGAELFPWLRFGRVDVQANLVDRVLLDGANLRDMQDPGRPRLQICTTDLRSGVAVGLSADGVAIRSPARPAQHRTDGKIPYRVTREFHPKIDPDTRIADLVAASGAFPGAFGAVDLTLPPVGDRSERRLLLADGGIVDNWGIGLLLDRARMPGNNPWRIDLLLVSAGGRVFEEGQDVQAPEELRRAIDIVYETAGWRPMELVGQPELPPIVLVQPMDLDPESIEYRTFAESSTLTDKFTAEEAGHLFDLGRDLVRNAAGELNEILASFSAGERLP